MTSHNFQCLSRQIIAMSEAKTWAAARLEWSIVGIERADLPETCLCSHFPISELCYLQNRLNGNVAMVGNVCVRRFLRLRSDLIFDGIKRVQADPAQALNRAAIDFFWNRGVLTEWERGFLKDTLKKRALSGPQLKVRKLINGKVLSAFRGINIAMT